MNLSTAARHAVAPYLIESTLGEIDVLTNSTALELIYDRMFIAEWDELYADCPWATIFQTSDFVASWYKHYSDKHAPIIVLSRFQGKLTGLFTLAQGIRELGIAGAGGHDAYYHIWLSTPAHGESFIQAALKVLLNRFSGQDICLKYIPQNVPMSWIERSDNWRRLCVLRNFSRPLMNLSNSTREQVLSKRGFKEKYNRVKRLGRVEFEMITDPVAFDAILDQLADQYDFRKAATLNIMPFRDDPAKKPFLLDLFHRGVLIAAVLKVDGNIISGITATTMRAGWSHGAGINTHSPAYSRYSPGYLIMKFLSAALIEASVTMFDITPGGHAYKDSHADEHDSLIEVRVTNPFKALYLQQFYKVKELLKARMEKGGIDTRNLRKIVSNKLVTTKEKLFLFKNVPSLTTHAISSSIKVTKIIPEGPIQQAAIPEIKKDCLKDILLFNPVGSGVTRWEFMKKAMKLYEAGFIPYTYCKNRQLLLLVWLAPQECQVNSIKEVVYKLPPGSVILCDLYCHSKMSEKIASFINGVTQKVIVNPEAKPIFLLESLNFPPRKT